MPRAVREALGGRAEAAVIHVYQRVVGGAGGCCVWDGGDIVSLSGVRHARLRIPVRILFFNERCARLTGRNFGGMC